MAPADRPPGGADGLSGKDVESVGQVFAAAVADRPDVGAAKLDGFLNGALFPFLGLHGTVIGVLILGVEAPTLFARLSPLFLAPAAAVGLVAWLRSRRPTGPGPSQAPTGAFCLLLIAFYGLPSALDEAGWSHVAYWARAEILIVVAYWLLLTRAASGGVPTVELVFPSFYVALFALILWEDAPLGVSAVVYVACFVPGMLVLWNLKRMQHAVGLLLGGAVLLIGELERQDAGEAGAIGLVVLFIVAFFIYELFVGAARHSNLRHFLSQGIGVLLILVAVTLLLDGLLADRAVAWAAAGVVAAYSVAMALFRGQAGVPTRFAWVAIALLLPVWYGADPDWYGGFAFWGPMAASLALVLALGSGARAVRNGFVLNLARGLALILCAVVYAHAASIEDQAVSPLEDRIAALVEADEAEDDAGGDAGWLPRDAREDEDPVTTLVMQATAPLGRPLLGAVVLLLLAYAVGTQAASETAVPRAIPWWHGLVRARHAAIARRSARAVYGPARSAPVIGNVLSFLGTVIG